MHKTSRYDTGTNVHGNRRRDADPTRRKYYGNTITHLLSKSSGTAGAESSVLHMPSLSSLAPGSKPSVMPALFRLRPKKPVSLRLLLGVVFSAVGRTVGMGGIALSEGCFGLPRSMSEKSAVFDRSRPGERPGPMVACRAREREGEGDERV